MEKEETNYDKVCNHFQSGETYSKEEIINGLIKLGIAPEGEGILSKLGQEICFRASRGKQLGEKVAMTRFIRDKPTSSYKLGFWFNDF